MSEKKDKPSKTPPLDEALKQVKSSREVRDSSEQKFIAMYTRESITAEMQYAHLRGVQDHYKLKRDWSSIVICLMALMVFFQMILLMNVGTGTWDFREYDWLLPTLMLQYFGQVVGLAYLIVKSLYKELS